MKHRLPKPKSSKSGLGDRSSLEQSELPIDEQNRLNASGASPDPDAAPSSSESNPTVNPANENPDFSETPPSPDDLDESSSGSADDAFIVPQGLDEATETHPATGLVSPPGEPLPSEVENEAGETSSPEAVPEAVEPFSFLPGPENPPLMEDRTDETSSPEGKEGEPALPTENKRKGATPPPLPVPARRMGPPPLPAPTIEPAPLLIQTHGLVKQYGGRRVVNGVDIHVRTGEVVGLLGKNGAGKTTTFYMIVGLVPPTQGTVFMADEDVTRMPMYRRARRGIGYLPQEESIFRKLTVEENLLAILETLPMTEEERDARCDELLKDFGLEHVRQNVAITLSGGEKRRVTIARALVTSPTLLLLDEPFSGVDPMAVHDIQEIILHLKERGLGVLITDHNVRETLSVVDRAYIIDEGRVLSEGSREFLLNDPIAREIYLGHRFSM